jgi:hypothetical protein
MVETKYELLEKIVYELENVKVTIQTQLMVNFSLTCHLIKKWKKKIKPNRSSFLENLEKKKNDLFGLKFIFLL